MSLIYIADANGNQQRLTPEQVRQLWEQGAIETASLYWQEGMSDWRPLSEFLAAAGDPAPAAAPSAAVPAAAPRGFVKDPAGRTKALIVLLWIYLATTGVAALLSGVGLATGQLGNVDAVELTRLEIAGLLVALPQLLVVVVTGIVFLMWIHLANRNARGLGAQGMTFTPGWSVGWYFIPVANLWKPYQAMKQIWQASANPGAWQSQKPPNLLSVWWTLWVISHFLSNTSLRLSLRADTSAELIVAEVITLLSDIGDIALCLVAIQLVRGIIRLQRHWAGQAPASICAICQKPVDPSEMVHINQSSVCAGCKPILLQQMQEGVAGQ